MTQLDSTHAMTLGMTIPFSAPQMDAGACLLWATEYSCNAPIT